ncbi:hypothetical protein BMF77_00145 [Dolichospermum sp. UHCC 0315A]|jgi:hypothetical protein|nr:hypothetical protein BMF77_00145 [Dolichospermum sp. UHCC 0315A]
MGLSVFCVILVYPDSDNHHLSQTAKNEREKFFNPLDTSLKKCYHEIDKEEPSYTHKRN